MKASVSEPLSSSTTSRHKGTPLSWGSTVPKSSATSFLISADVIVSFPPNLPIQQESWSPWLTQTCRVRKDRFRSQNRCQAVAGPPASHLPSPYLRFLTGRYYHFMIKNRDLGVLTDQGLNPRSPGNKSWELKPSELPCSVRPTVKS